MIYGFLVRGSHKASSMIAAICTLTFGALFINFNVAAQVPALPPGFIVKWDIGIAGNALEQEFVVMEYKVYQIEIIFSPNSKTSNKETFDELRRVVGDGTFEIDAGIARPSKSKTATGVVIPVQMQISRLNFSGSEIIINKLVETEGMVGAGSVNSALLANKEKPLNASSAGGLIRHLYEINLQPGRYRITTTTTQSTKLPKNVETILSVTGTPNVKPPKI